MSYDFALERPCTHEVKFERVQVASDLDAAVRFPRPPVSHLVTLWIGGVEVPRSGLYSFAEVPLGPEPYRISAASDSLLLKLPGSPVQAVQLPVGGSVSASDLARAFSRAVPELSVSDEAGRVVLRSRARGPAVAFSFPDPRWTDRLQSSPATVRGLGALRALGIVPGRAAAGRLLFPGWSVERDVTSPLESSRILKFAGPLRHSDPVIQVCYFTDAPNCRRCRGSRIEFDYGVSSGRYETVDGSDLLIQEFDKFLFTKAGSHFKWPWLGSRLMDRIGGKGAAANLSPSAFIQVDISQAFRTYRDVKTQQDRGLQDVSDAEFPHSLGGISVVVPSDDPTVAVVTLSLTSRSRDPVVLKRVVGTPDPFQLTSGPGGTFRLRG